jgi:hypothetical protein
MPATWKKLAYADDVVLKTLFSSANSIIAAETANAPAVLAVAANGIVGRLSTAAIASLTPANVRTIINVEDGAQTCNATRVAAAGAVMESDFAANGDIIYSAANTAAILGIGANGEVLKVASGLPSWEADAGGVAFVPTANATTRGALTPTLGEGSFQEDTLECYVCTVIA